MITKIKEKDLMDYLKKKIFEPSYRKSIFVICFNEGRRQRLASKVYRDYQGSVKEIHYVQGALHAIEFDNAYVFFRAEYRPFGGKNSDKVYFMMDDPDGEFLTDHENSRCECFTFERGRVV